MAIKTPTDADGKQAGPGLKKLTSASLGQASDGTAKKDGSDLFKGRRLVVWEIPYVAEEPIRDEAQRRFVQMYINPQNLQINSRKLISETRTKAGYVNQYWGEELETVNIQGTTGDAGIEGINVLRDIYRSEQIALLNMIKRASSNIKRRQSLMQLAASVIMWYDGQGMMGYFTDMSYTEAAQKPGVFDYQLNFKATRVIGQRQNFMPWHRRPHSTAEVPFKLEQVGRGMTDGDLNVPPIGDVKNNAGGQSSYAFHKRDPRDEGRGFSTERYDELQNFSGIDIIFGGVKSFLTQGIEDLTRGIADEITEQAQRIPIIGSLFELPFMGTAIQGLTGAVVGEAGNLIGDALGDVDGLERVGGWMADRF